MLSMKESIFSSSLRSFFRGFFSILGIFFAIIPVMILLGAFMGQDVNTPKSSIYILPDHDGNSDLLPQKTPVVLQIDIQGIIGVGEYTAESIQNQLIESRKGIFKNNRVKAILLNLNTRGGSAFDSDNIHSLLLDYKKRFNTPIYAYVNGINASGGVFVSCAADKILATPPSVIGSVGVLMGPFINVSKTLEKIGMESLTLTNGKNKDALNPLRPWKEDESDSLKLLNEYFYNRFVDIVANSRPMLSKEKLISTYGANVYPAPIAEKYGYVDSSNSSYREALLELLKAASIDSTKPYQVVKIKSKKAFFEELFDSNALFKGKIKHEIDFKGSDLKEDALYLYMQK
jgi:protease IV